MASYSNVGHKGPREFWVETQNYWDVYLFTILVYIYKTVTCVDYRKWFIAVCWMIYPGIYKYIWNYLCKLISSESSYDNSLMNFNKHLWNIFCLWVCPDPFSQYRLSKNVCSAVQWYTELSHALHQNKQQMFQKKSNLKVKYQCSAFFLWMNYIVKSDPEEPSNIPWRSTEIQVWVNLL